ncbi:Auxin response factor 17 [Hordeum vulgare]|nr:Auxin response factor 17 [Hordeum vulgare]
MDQGRRDALERRNGGSERGELAASTNKEIEPQIPNYLKLPPQLICQLHNCGYRAGSILSRVSGVVMASDPSSVVDEFNDSEKSDCDQDGCNEVIVADRKSDATKSSATLCLIVDVASSINKNLNIHNLASAAVASSASFDDVNTINDVLFDLCGAEKTAEAEKVDPSAEHGDCIEDPLCSLQLTVMQSQSVDGTEPVTQEEDVPFELLLEDQHKKRKLAAFERKKAARLQKGSNASESVDLVELMLDSDNLVVHVKKKFKRIASKKCPVDVVIPRKSPRLASPSLGELPGSGCEVVVVTPRRSPHVLAYAKPSPPIGSSLSAKAKRCGVKRKGGPAKVNKGCKNRSRVDADDQDVVDEDLDDEYVDQV